MTIQQYSGGSSQLFKYRKAAFSRKVKLQHDSSSTVVLNIGEVEVYDQSGTNRALNKAATQSSGIIYPASEAVDGNANTFSHTNIDSGKLMLETKLFYITKGLTLTFCVSLI